MEFSFSLCLEFESGQLNGIPAAIGVMYIEFMGQVRTQLDGVKSKILYMEIILKQLSSKSIHVDVTMFPLEKISKL